MSETFAIVGASLAGARAAHQLRQEGFDGRLVLIGAEPHLPYERPPLSKDVLVGTAEPESTQIWPESAYADAEIDLVLATRVSALRPGERRLELADGRALSVDRVLLCTGARPRALPIPGTNMAGVYELRSLDDALGLREALQPGARVVVVGAGFIGAEVAAAAVNSGCTVTMVEVADLPLQRVLGPEVGALYAALHRSQGVDVRLGVGVERIEGSGHCRAVTLSDGSPVPADVVVCGIGATPRIELAQAAGIAVGNGVVVDHACRSSIDHVYASGDVANRPTSYGPEHVRLESWQNAQNQSIAAAKAMVGADVVFDDVPWFWSDQFDVNLQVAGFPSAGDEIVQRGEPGAFDGTVLYVRDGVVRGVVGLNRPRDTRAAMGLIRTRAQVTPAALADESVDLRKIPVAPTSS